MMMDINLMQGGGGGSGAGNHLDQDNHHYTSSARASSSPNKFSSQSVSHHQQYLHRPNTADQSLQHAQYLPVSNAVVPTIEQTQASWAGTNVPLPFNLHQFHGQNLTPLRPCDGVYNFNNGLQNSGPLSDSAVQHMLEQCPSQPDGFYHPPQSAPSASFFDHSAFGAPKFDSMAAFAQQHYNHVAENVKQNARSTPNIYRTPNAAPITKRARSNDLQRHSAEPMMTMQTRKSTSRGATAEPPTKRPRTFVVAGPDAVPEFLPQTAAPQSQQPSTAPGDDKSDQHVAAHPGPSAEPQQNIDAPPGTAETQCLPNSTHAPNGLQTSQNENGNVRSRRATTKAKNAATAAAVTAAAAKKSNKDTPSGKRQNVSEESWANIVKYSTPDLDLDWTKETEKGKRRHMQMIIASKVRADKKKADAAAKATPKVDSSNTVAGSSSQQQESGMPMDIDTERAPETPSKSTPASTSSRSKIAKPPLPTQKQPNAAIAPKELSVMPYPSPDESLNAGDLALPDHTQPQAEIKEATPEPEEDEELLRLKVARFDALIKLKTLEQQRTRQQSTPTPPTNLIGTSLASSSLRPYHDVDLDKTWVEAVKLDLVERGKAKKGARDYDTQSANRLFGLLEIAQPPDNTEALFLSGEEAAEWVKPNHFFPGPIITEGQQSAPLQQPQDFLNEYPDDGAEIWIQDPAVKLHLGKPHARTVTVKQVKERLASKDTKHPWNCLELATHFDDGLRPAFLNNEDCRLLTKLKIPGEKEKAARRGYEEGWKEVEKWALVAQAGALTEPHQDSHGYSTFITVNKGPIGFGWLSNPTSVERKAWNAHHGSYDGGRWRYVVLKAGQTVYFPSGTVHFVFRLTSAGNTLAYGGHVLRCSQIVRWVKTLLDEQAQPNITNEDLSQSAPGYLERVEKFVKHARRMGQQDKWGGPEAFDEFLRLKQKFNNK